eukprot:6211869-Pleurochrysis_carterae.AAC.2
MAAFILEKDMSFCRMYRSPHWIRSGNVHSQEWPSIPKNIQKIASILGNGRFWPISVYSLEWSTILEDGSFPTWGPTFTNTCHFRRSAPSCAVPLSQPGAWRCRASHPPAPRAISHRPAPCAVRLATPSAVLTLKSSESRVESSL